MMINLLFLLLGILLDSISNTLLITDFSYQSLVLTSFYALNILFILSHSISQKQLWSFGMLLALLSEIARPNSYLFSFLIIALIIILLNLFNKTIGESLITQVIISSVLIFCFQMISYSLYSIVKAINISFITFIQIEVIGNLFLNVIVSLIVIFINSKRIDYLERKDQFKRSKEKVLIIESED